MKLEIDIPEHHYNNIMALDSVSLGRVPYKGIIMYTINAIKHGKVLEQEPTTKNDLGVDCISRKAALEITWHDPSYSDPLNVLTEIRDKIRELPSVTPQEPKTGRWIANAPQYDMLNPQYICSECGNAHTRTTPYCEMCGAKMVESQESEAE